MATTETVNDKIQLEKPVEDRQGETSAKERSEVQQELPILINLQENVASVERCSSVPTCRICFSSTSGEDLVKPCKCKGTMGYVHRMCLERWLATSNTDACELCRYHFTTQRKRKSFWRWCIDPSARNERRNLLSDLMCFFFLTPLGLASFWLCLQGALYFYKHQNGILEATSLLALSIFLVLSYFTWIVMALRYHFAAWAMWHATSWDIRLMDSSHRPQNNEEAESPLSSSRPDTSRAQPENVTRAAEPSSSDVSLQILPRETPSEDPSSSFHDQNCRNNDKMVRFTSSTISVVS